MDVGNFISDLLAQHGSVSVPGLGYFAHTRINGHYNEREGKMYPPTYSVQFEPQVVEDETLAQYMADRKNISLASAKYFTEKYINNIKLQAQDDDVPLADLGWFYTEEDQLYFRPGSGIGSDPEFFGYEPVNLYKLGTAPVQSVPVYTAPQPVEEPTFVAPVAIPDEEEQAPDGYRYETDAEHEAYLTGLARKKRRNSTIIFVVLAVVLTAAVVFLVNRYDSTIFNLEAPKPKPTKTPEVIHAKVDTLTPVDTAKKVVKKDSASTSVIPAVTDTIAKSVPVVDTKITGPRYEIIAGAFSSIAKADVEISKYEKMGFTAHIAEGVPGKKHNISLGTYRSKGDAAAALDKILNTGKIKPTQVYILPIDVR